MKRLRGCPVNVGVEKRVPENTSGLKNSDTHRKSDCATSGGVLYPREELPSSLTATDICSMVSCEEKVVTVLEVVKTPRACNVNPVYIHTITRSNHDSP